jgi:hypothetical protein
MVPYHGRVALEAGERTLLTMGSVSFETTLERDKDGSWWYAHVPKTVRQSFEHPGKRGVIPLAHHPHA